VIYCPFLRAAGPPQRASDAGEGQEADEVEEAEERKEAEEAGEGRDRRRSASAEAGWNAARGACGEILARVAGAGKGLERWAGASARGALRVASGGWIRVLAVLAPGRLERSLMHVREPVGTFEVRRRLLQAFPQCLGGGVW
jgi:hypothetical protein